MRILIVEDEPALREGVTDLLRARGHAVESTGDGIDAVQLATAVPFDLVVLDLALPRLDGIEVCRRIRLVRPGLAVLMLTARASEEEKVEGLGVGADDYVTKPFGARELVARVEALARRLASVPRDLESVEADGCELDLGHCRGRRDGITFELTPREAGILRWLHRHRSRTVTRGELLEHVWGAAADLDTRTVDMTIANLRRKIERDGANPRIVQTVKGAGYVWGDP